MTVSVRSLITPGVAVATAGVVALAPAVVAPAALSSAAPTVPVPTVHIDSIALAGIGRDIYNSITPSVQYGVSLAQYSVSFIPYIGPPIADQIGINYFNLIQPLIANTVYVLSDIFADPFNLPGWTNSYLINQAYVGLSYVNAQAQFFGAPPFPPFPFPPAPPLASTRGAAPSASSASSRTARQAAAAAAVVADDPAPLEAATPAVDAQAPVVSPSRSGVTRAARAAASAPRRDAAAVPGAAARSAASVARSGEGRQGARTAAARPAASVG